MAAPYLTRLGFAKYIPVAERFENGVLKRFPEEERRSPTVTLKALAKARVGRARNVARRQQTLAVLRMLNNL